VRICVGTVLVIVRKVLVLVERSYGVKRVIGIGGGVILVLERLQHFFSIFTAVNVESKVMCWLTWSFLNAIP